MLKLNKRSNAWKLLQLLKSNGSMTTTLIAAKLSTSSYSPVNSKSMQVARKAMCKLDDLGLVELFFGPRGGLERGGCKLKGG